MKNVPEDAGHIERDYLYQISSFFYSNHKHLSLLLFSDYILEVNMKTQNITNDY